MRRVLAKHSRLTQKPWGSWQTACPPGPEQDPTRTGAPHPGLVTHLWRKRRSTWVTSNCEIVPSYSSKLATLAGSLHMAVFFPSSPITRLSSGRVYLCPGQGQEIQAAHLFPGHPWFNQPPRHGQVHGPFPGDRSRGKPATAQTGPRWSLTVFVVTQVLKLRDPKT